MSKKRLVVKQKHIHHWILDGSDAARSNSGIIVEASCKTCGATTTFLNHIEWAVIEKRAVPEVVDTVDVLLEDDG